VIPLHLLTGFLGAGKTTVLARLLQAPLGERIAVLVNEAGELALDHHLLEQVTDDVVALPSGCLCCTIRGELHLALERVLALAPARIVLETTGLADPAPILHLLATDPQLSRSVRIAGVIAVLDVERAERLLATHAEVRRQLQLADRVLLTRLDRAPQRQAEVRALVAALAPGAEVRHATHGAADPRWLLDEAPLPRLGDVDQVRLWLHHGDGGPTFRTHVVQRAQPAAVDLVQLWLRLVTQLDGDRLLRIKGLVECAATGDVFVLQSAGHAVSPPRRLGRQAGPLRGVQLVLIERDLSDTVVAQLLATLDGALAGTPLR
jgi:G3E family GTPase